MINKYYIDDFLSKDHFNAIQTYLLSNDFDWYFQKNVTDHTASPSLKDFGFTHNFIVDGKIVSESHTVIERCVLQIQKQVPKAGKCLRARADMTVVGDEKYLHGWHTDCDEPHIVSILYLHDSDAPTLLRDGFECHSRQNRLFIFDGETEHTGYSPTNAQRRVVINFNFEKF